MSYAMGEYIFSHRRIYDCSSDGCVAPRVWGWDRKGHQINELITCVTEKLARCTAVRLLDELGPRVHFWIHQ
jgi:hypothetical protein